MDPGYRHATNAAAEFSCRCFFAARIFWIACGLLCLLPVQLPASPQEPEPAQVATSATWLTSWEAGMRQAQEKNRPMLAYFTSQYCGWCKRLDEDWLRSDVQKALSRFVLVRVDIGEHPQTALRERVQGVPTLLVVQPDTDIRRRVSGYSGREALLQFLTEDVAPLADEAEPEDKSLEDRLRQLGEGRDRVARIRSILTEQPFPAKELVAALEDRSLAVRLGAFEVLETRTGQGFRFDPWTPTGDQPAALARWQEWASNATGDDSFAPAASSFSERQVAGYVTELFASDPDRSRRALAMLMEGGEPVARHLGEIAADNNGLPRRERLLLRQARYATVLAEWRADHPERLSRDLVFGDPSVRTRALGALARFAPRSLVLIEEFLTDPDPFVRESAVETLTGAGGPDALPAIERMWNDERETDVRIGILRAVGEVPSQASVDLLTGALSEESEDVIVLALDYLRRLTNYRHDAERIGGLLDDSRWRVRSAALEAIQQLRIREAAPKVVELLEDEDEFVRLSALAALGRIAERSHQPRLEEMFRQVPEMRLPLLEIYTSNDWKIPDSFADLLTREIPAGRESEFATILTHLEKQQLPLALRFIDHPNEDFSIAALMALATHGTDKPEHREKMIAFLRDGTRGQKAAVLRTFDPDYADLPRLDEPASDASPPGGGGFLQRLFGGGGQSRSSAGPHPLQPFEEAASALLESRDEELRLEAAIFLTRLGSKNGLDILMAALDEMTPEELDELADAIRNVSAGHIRDLRIAIFQRLERHTWGLVRGIFEHGSFPDNLRLILDLAPRPVPEYYQRFLNDIPDHRRPPPIEQSQVREILHETFEKSADVPLLVFVLKQWAQVLDWGEDREWILKQANHSEPLVRRAALRLAIETDRDLLPELAEKIASDPDHRVREVLPAAVQKNEAWWSHIFSDDFRGMSWSFTSHTSFGQARTKPKVEPLPPTVDQSLREMTNDPVHSIRLRAMIALGDVYQEIDDIERLRSHLDRLDRRDHDFHQLQRWISGFLYTHYKEMGPEYESLLRFASSSGSPFGTYERESIDTLREHFHRLRQPTDGSDAEPTAGIAALREEHRQQEPATLAFAADTIVNEDLRIHENGTQTSGSIPLVFFTQTGCSDCAQVREYLAQLAPVFPELEVRSYNIRDTRAIRLNEYLSEEFSVPVNNRLVAPMIATAAGVLVRDEINLDSLSRMVGDAWGLDTSILAMPEEAIALTDTRIVERFHGFTLTVVLVAGLLDGLNPCALATIIFFLSYLQVARRTPARIMQVGFAFVLGIFLAYFAIGVGFYSLIGHLTALEPVARAVNWILAAVVLVICLLSIRDGVLCLRGRLKDTALQLPKPLKNRINAIVRTGVRHAHFVIAAFLMGMAIALLELACTGQMYAPTIMLVVQSGAERTAALGFLLIYNIAFVLPLIIIVLLAWRGLKSDRLMTFFQQNVATVKFANAALFAVLFGFFIFVLL